MSHKSFFESQISLTKGKMQSFDKNADVVFLELPFFLTREEHTNNSERINNKLLKLFSLKNKNATVCILCSPVSAFEIFDILEKQMSFKLFVSIKLSEPIVREGYISSNFGSLLVFTGYKTPLRHTKTRIAYTYCPACGKTTKDYGGKKHLFDSYGTIISDVWRDISWDLSCHPVNIIERIQDMFSVDGYKLMTWYSLSRDDEIPHNGKNTFHSDKSFINNIGLQSKLILGDVLETLNKLPSNSIDFCFADPPYNLKKKYNDWNDGIDIKNYFNWCDEWLAELLRVLKPGGVLSVINIPQWAARHYQFLRDKLLLVDIITWEGLSIPVRMIMPANYIILSFSKGKVSPSLSLDTEYKKVEAEALRTVKEFYCSRQSCLKKRTTGNDDKELISNIWWDIHRLKHNSVRVDHPCQLPPSLMYRLISLYTRPDDIVLDPFNGSGTTTLTAQQLNRKFIGIELTEYYHQIASNRHNELESGMDPFRKRNDPSDAKAKNSYVKRMPKMKYAVSKKKLQLEIKNLAMTLGRIPTEADISEHSDYPIEYFKQYFINWSEVIAATRTTGMSEVPDKSMKV